MTHIYFVYCHEMHSWLKIWGTWRFRVTTVRGKDQDLKRCKMSLHVEDWKLCTSEEAHMFFDGPLDSAAE